MPQIALWRCNCYGCRESVGAIAPRVIQRRTMKKTTSTRKTPAPATKQAAPAPVRPSTAASKAKSLAAPAPVAPPPASPVVMAKPKAAGVTITAKIDVGFGNALFVRGSGAGLSWGKGALLTCVSSDTWRIVLPGASGPFAFKFLLNDETWSAGKDYLAGPGDTVTVTPAF